MGINQSVAILVIHKKAFMGVLQQIGEYLYLKKKDPNKPTTQWTKYMHGINRISILLFLLALVILAVKLIVKKG